jgi:hypothetical protein
MLSTLLLPFDGSISTTVDVQGVRHSALRLMSASAAVSSEESKVVGEAWKVLDKAYVDKSFSGNDWVSRPPHLALILAMDDARTHMPGAAGECPAQVREAGLQEH